MSAIVQCYITLFYLGALYLACSDANEFLRKIYGNEANVSDDVTETQHATCKIATEEVVANAHATITTVLTGACKAKAMNERFASLEEKLIKELANIKWLLHRVLEEYSVHLTNINSYNETFKSYLSPRQDEIDKFNNTVQNLQTLNGSINTFVYYWEVKKFDDMLANWQTGRSVRSPTFYVDPTGYAMYLKITPKYFPDGTVFVGVGLTRGRYDSVLIWPFPLRIRLEVLDHSLENTREDRRSRIWDPATVCMENFWGRPPLTGLTDNPECVGLSISRHIILSKSLSTTFQHSHLKMNRYMWKKSLLIKLIVYL